MLRQTMASPRLETYPRSVSNPCKAMGWHGCKVTPVTLFVCTYM